MCRLAIIAVLLGFFGGFGRAEGVVDWVVVHSGKPPVGYSDLQKASDINQVVQIASKLGFEIYQRKDCAVVLASDVLMTQSLALRCAWLDRLKKNGQASYLVFEGEDLNSPEVKDAAKCFSGSLDFKNQAKNPKFRMAMYASKNLILSDGKSTFSLSLADQDPVVREKQKIAFDADPKLFDKDVKPGDDKSALDLASTPLNELAISIHSADNRISTRIHLLEELNAVIKEQLEPYQKMLDSADELVNWLFTDPKSMAATNVAPGSAFDDMPKELQDRIADEVGKNLKAYGLQDASDVQGFLRKLRLGSVQSNCFVFAWMKMPNGSYKGMGYQIHLGN